MNRIIAAFLAIPVIAGVAYFAPVHLQDNGLSWKNIQTDNSTTFASKNQPGKNWFVEQVADKNWFVEQTDTNSGVDLKTVAESL